MGFRGQLLIFKEQHLVGSEGFLQSLHLVWCYLSKINALHFRTERAEATYLCLFTYNLCIHLGQTSIMWPLAAHLAASACVVPVQEKSVSRKRYSTQQQLRGHLRKSPCYRDRAIPTMALRR